MRRSATFVNVILFSCAASVFGATINVPADQGTIQAGIDAAVSGVDEVVVAPGTYDEIIDTLGKAITVRSSGGAAVTTIDATLVIDPGTGKPVIRCDSGEFPDTVIDGFTLTGGTGDSSTSGGGMYNLLSNPTVQNCVFINNNAVNGGGMYNGNFSGPMVTNCTFIGNQASFGAGMYNTGTREPTVTGCTFANNSAASGGGMYNGSGNSPPVSSCTFTGNIANGNGGAIFNSSNNDPTLSNCIFEKNSAMGFGGAIYLGSGSAPEFTDCTFNENTAAAGGGAVYCVNNCDPKFVNCGFIKNTANNGAAIRGQNGGSITATNCTFSLNTAMGQAGAIYNAGNNVLTAENCVFTKNLAHGNGGSIYNVSNSVSTLINCTFSRNSAVVSGGGGYTAGGTWTASNCIFWENADGGGIDESAQIHVVGGAQMVDFSDVQGGWSGSGSNNLNVDPLFVNASIADIHLFLVSPCIDVGDNSVVTEAMDVFGGTRIFNGVVDMGAYEAQSLTVPADVNEDNDVDTLDFTVFASCFNKSGNPPRTLGCPPGDQATFDFDNDNDVDTVDFAAFSSCFNKSGNPPRTLGCPQY